MTELKIGYARVSTTGQDLTAQRNALAGLGVDPKRVYVDHGMTGTNRARPGLGEALAACRTGDTLVVTKLDRLARSVPDARDIVDDLTGRGVRLNIGGSLHDPTDPVGVDAERGQAVALSGQVLADGGDPGVADLKSGHHDQCAV